MRRTARLTTIALSNAVVWTALWLTWPARDSLPRLADLGCGGTYAAPGDDSLRAARDAMVGAAAGDPERVGPYLASLAADRAGPDPAFGRLVAAVHQTALDHGLGLHSAPRRARLLPDPSRPDGPPEYVLRYRAGTKWTLGWHGNHEAAIRLAVGLDASGGRLVVTGEQSWRRPFSRGAPLPRGSVACPPLPDGWDEARVEAMLRPAVPEGMAQGIAGMVVPAAAVAPTPLAGAEPDTL